MMHFHEVILLADETDDLMESCREVMKLQRKFRCRVTLRYKGKRIVKESGDGMGARELYQAYMQLELELLHQG